MSASETINSLYARTGCAGCFGKAVIPSEAKNLTRNGETPRFARVTTVANPST